MTTAVLFGSIGVLAETSELQRKAFNQAFEEADLDWHWSADVYASMLRSSGGKDWIESYARDRRTSVDAAALHARKSEIFQTSLAKGVAPRAGVNDVIGAAQALGIPLGFVTTTSPENVRRILAATNIPVETFAFIGHRDLVRIGKPSAEIYRLAIQHLGIQPEDALAVEDSALSARAALAAGIPLIAFPGEMHAQDVFENALTKTQALSPRMFGLGTAQSAVA